MIGLLEFKLLSYPYQVMYLCEKGVFIANRIHQTHKAKLYHLNTFFVEVIIDLNPENILGLRAFTHNSGLEPYLEHINLKI